MESKMARMDIKSGCLARWGSSALAVVALSMAAGVGCMKVPLLAPSGSSITLTASASVLPINGSTEIIAQVLESGGTPPHSGTHVTFTTTLGTMQPSEAQTDINGRVFVKFLAGSASGTAVINALSGGASTAGTTSTTGTTTTTTSGALKIAVGNAAVGGVRVSANPTTLPAAGGTTTIVATVLDTNSNPLPSVVVTFTTTAGTLSASGVNTDSVGNAMATLTTNKQATVTATAGLSTTTTGGTSGTGTTPAPSNTVTINVNTVSSVTVGAPSPATPIVGQAVTFSLTLGGAAGSTGSTGAPVQRITVDWGDGSTETLTGTPTAIVHTYRAPGSFTVRVTTLDTFGDSASGTNSVTVGRPPQITATISSSTQNPTPNTAVTFTINATPSATGCAIDTVTVSWGDGQTDTFKGATTSVQHSYRSQGNYTVQATLTDTCGSSGSASTGVSVSPRAPLTPSITAGGTLAPNSPVTLTISAGQLATGCAVDTVVVNFGDGQSRTFQGQTTSVQHVYPAGTYTATVTVTDTCGSSGSASTAFTVVSGAPTASFTASPNPAKVGQAVQFNATASTGDLVTFTFDYGDGGFDSGSSRTQTHTYTAVSPAAGYTVTLTVTDSQGRTATSTKQVVVTP